MTYEVQVDKWSAYGYRRQKPMSIEQMWAGPMLHPTEIEKSFQMLGFREDVKSALMKTYRGLWHKEQNSFFEYYLHFEIVPEMLHDGMIKHHIVMVSPDGRENIGSV